MISGVFDHRNFSKPSDVFSALSVFLLQAQGASGLQGSEEGEGRG